MSTPPPWYRATAPDLAYVETDDDEFLTVERWPHEVFRPHYHEEFNWIVPMRPGRVVVSVEGREHALDANRWVCIAPRTPHAIVHVSDDCEVLSLFVSSEAMERAWHARAEPTAFHERCIVGGSGTIAQGLALAWGEARFARRARDEVDEAFERFLTGWLWRAYQPRVESAESWDVRLRIKLGRAGDAVAGFLEAHLADAPFPWDTLATQLGLSRRTLQRQFVDALGRSPSDVLAEMRLERARALLADPARSVGDIAYACGFASPSHFSTTFKAALGVSPVRFRAGLGSGATP